MAPRRKKTRTHVKPGSAKSTAAEAPKSFVVRHGQAGRSVDALVRDIRSVLEPNTSTRLKERNSGKMMDYVTMAGPLGVGHILVLGRTASGVNMRLAKLPHGPTFGFRVVRYSLATDIRQSQRKPSQVTPECNLTPALLVLNAFPQDRPEMKLLTNMLQSLFPAIQVGLIHLSSARRLLLLNYNAATGTIDWRHFLISVRATGVSKRVRRLPTAHSLPDLSNTQDVADYLLGTADGYTTGSDSEMDTDAEQVELATDFPGRNAHRGDKRAVRLTEIGPRMELRLCKITDVLAGAGKGKGEGAVLFHQFVQKSKKDAEKQKRDHAAKKAESAKRRAEQEANVARKKAAAKAAGEEVSSSDEDETGDTSLDKKSEKGPVKPVSNKRKNAPISEESSDDNNGDDQDEFAYEDAMGDDMELFDPEE